MPTTKKPKPKKKLYWCTTLDGDEDWFIIAHSAREARSWHAAMEGYISSEVDAELVTVLPDKWQMHVIGWPDLDTSVLKDCGGVKIQYQPSSNQQMRALMGVVTEAWRFKERTFIGGDIVGNIEAINTTNNSTVN